MTIEQLEELGISNQQARLYLAALELSPASVASISKKAGMERTAAYPHLEELIKMGLLSIGPEKRRRVYIAQDPHSLGNILENRSGVYKKLLPELMSVFNTKGMKPKIRYYEGRDGLRTAMHNTLLSGSKLNLHLVPMNNVLEVLGEEFSRRYIEERVAFGIHARSLRVKEAVEGPWEIVSRDKSLLRDLRYLPNDFELDDLIIIHANIVTIISSIHENYAVEIESKEFANTMKSFFNVVWQIAEKK